MSFISWNCQGLGSLSTVPNLKYLVRTYKPDGIFLSETMAAINKIEELKYILSFDSCFTVDRIGRGGGLAFLWKKSVSCNITNYSQNHIDIEVDDSLIGGK
jgi:exonuclease III